MSRTLILVKPDAFERGLTGEVIARFERKGLRIGPAAGQAQRRAPHVCGVGAHQAREEQVGIHLAQKNTAGPR